MLLSLKLTFFLTIFLCVRGNWGLRQINYTQVLDHSRKTNNNSITFNQRVYLDDQYWGGAPSPIFAYFSGETYLDANQRIDLLTRSAQQFQGFVIYIEHRFYGESVPLGSIQSAMANHNVRECLSVEQTLLDFKEIIHSLKNNISAHDSPVIVVGAGYAGVLAVYFRLLYPNITLGALASSAPIMLFGNTTQMYGYCSKISQDFEDYSPKCHRLINESWSMIEDIASTPGGLQNLSRRFRACEPFHSVHDLKLSLAGLYAFATEYDTPKHELMFSVCIYMKADAGLIGGVAAALVETLGNGVCFGRYIAQTYSAFQPSTNFTLAWDWQRCNELVFPTGCESNPMRLPLQPFNLIQLGHHKNSERTWEQYNFFKRALGPVN